MKSLPKHIQIEITNECNLRCKMCLGCYNGYRTPKYLRLKDIQVIISQIPKCTEVFLHGIGEPLLNPHLIDMVSFLKREKKRILFATNATLLNPSISEMLIKTGLDDLTISINGATRETYEHIMQGANFSSVLENIQSLVNIKKILNSNLPKLSIAVVAMKSNFKEIPQIIKLALSLEIKKVKIYSLRHFPQTKGELLTVDDLELLKDLKKSNTNSRMELHFSFGRLLCKDISSSCKWPWEGTYITVDGWITPCCHIYDPELINLGNIFDIDFKSIWNSRQYLNFRKEFLKGSSKYCKGCSDYEPKRERGKNK